MSGVKVSSFYDGTGTSPGQSVLTGGMKRDVHTLENTFLCRVLILLLMFCKGLMSLISVLKI